MQNIICTVCPRGCRLQVEGETVTGNACPRGVAYGIAEATTPVRMLTATVGLQHKLLSRLPVRTDKPIPKSKLLEGMKALEGIVVCPPVTVGQVICADFLGTGANLISTREIPDKEGLL